MDEPATDRRFPQSPMATGLPVGATEAQGETPSRPARLRDLLRSPALAFIMEAHNGLSAKIVEEAGFGGIWASGLSMSAALGVRDSNEASWTQVLEMLEFMADATTIPILVDGDTGYGNFNNVRRLVKKLCQRGIAGVCIEDKLFPKTNSFIGENQPLADVDEFCGRIKAGKDSQSDDDFQIVARVEALIAGWGMDEALRRAEAYRQAGADAVLIHSKKETADEIAGFCDSWGGRAPVVIVPTMYHRTPTQAFRDAGVSMVIWANHNMRAAVSAMRAVSRQIRESESLVAVEDEIAPVRDVFALTGQAELAQAEAHYLAGGGGGGPRAILLAASRGQKLGPLTEHRPKCMIDVRGEPLLQRLVRTLNRSGLRDVTVVRGYRKEAIALAGIETVDNDRYGETGEAASLACASDRLDGPCLVSYGDILFRRHVLEGLLAADGDIVTVVDARRRAAAADDDDASRAPDRPVDWVRCTRPFTGGYLDDERVTLEAIWSDATGGDSAHGEFIGLTRLSEDGAALVRGALDAMGKDGTLEGADLPDLFARLIAAGTVIDVHYITGHWLDVDDAFDLASLRNLV